MTKHSRVSRSAKNGLVALIVMPLLGLTLSCSPDMVQPAEPWAPTTNAGTLIVTVATTGEAFDADGYVLTIDRMRTRRLTPNARATIPQVPAGHHTVELRSLAPNCVVIDGSQRSIRLTLGATVELTFNITCSPPTELAALGLVFVRDSQLYAMNGDGSDLTRLASGGFRNLSTSADSRRIAFERDTNIQFMDADGGGVSQLTFAGGYNPAWPRMERESRTPNRIGSISCWPSVEANSSS